MSLLSHVIRPTVTSIIIHLEVVYRSVAGTFKDQTPCQIFNFYRCSL